MRLLCYTQSFADIAKMPADRLQTLPGFGRVKVKKIKDAFEKPFRNDATSTLQTRSIFDASSSTGPNTNSSDGQDKETVISLLESDMTTRDRPRPREPSPVWDLELELDLDGNTDADNHILPENGPPLVSRHTDDSKLGRDESSSPVWDIELDLNGSDDDNDDERGNDGFGAAALL
jgi:DNA excision repair protein ERCC-1